MTRARFVADVQYHGGFPSDAAAGAAIDAVLVALADVLPARDAEVVAREAPDWLAARLRAGPHRECAPHQFFAAVGAAQTVAPGIAREQAGVVLQALVDELTPDGRRYLADALPAALSELTARREDTPAPPPVVHPRRQATLAGGRPGSAHPVSESRPDSVQSDSVARAADPHRDRKLSEARAPSDAIATARPRTGPR